KPGGSFGRRHLLHGARGGDADQLGRHFANARFHARFAMLPAYSAEPVELHARFFRAETRKELDVLDGQEQLAAVILQLQAVVWLRLNLDCLQPEIASDPVFDMGDEVAGSERRSFGKKILRAARTAPRSHHTVAENVLFGDNSDIGGFEPMFDAQYGEP